ncbi:NAD-dependent epimerase/dehydratase family protein [Micromonospora sp. NBS 11-29]|uniref:NAD-dependent epimerase/dehydratase family protein n=1 Tax=Micromonospora sp. NBS 11-29 TaxID=1960879 RepID=UPI000B77D9D7|nr:NAD-dependent epimerase/dehydratase family protein [Micromonospora sp. NBS 11-29]
MRLLMLGGTGFVGGAVVAEAVRRGWSVTVFNRGVHGEVPAGVHRLRGDRTAPDGLAALAGGEWDLVVDTWDGAPRAVRDAARALVGAVPHYVYVSSGSVYAPPVPLGTGEEVPTVVADPDADDGDYARNKAGGERAAAQVFGGRALLARAGLILGPGEDIGRLPWWLYRVARGGTVLAPGPRDLPIQYVDVRDLAIWLLDRGAEGVGGAYNVIGRTGHATMGELLDAAVAATGSDAALRWTDPAPILAGDVEPWNDLPIWVPRGHEYRWLQERDVERAYAAGLVCRPVGETVADTWRWLREVGGVPERAGRPARAPVGLAPEREAALLAGLPA